MAAAEESGDKDNHEIHPKDLLLPLVGALWAFTTLAVTMVLAINSIRDKIITGFDAGNHLTLAHRQLLYENDYGPLGDALVLASLLFGVFCGITIFLIRRPLRRWPVVGAILFTAGVPIAMAIFWRWTAPKDRQAMEIALASGITNTTSSGESSMSGMVINVSASNSTGINIEGSNTIFFNSPPNIEPRGTAPSAVAITDLAPNQTNTPSILIPPFKAETVAVSHSAFSGVMAGFALTSLFLLIGQKSDKTELAARSDPAFLFRKQHHSEAMLLLFAAFLTGSLSAYLYSIMTGDPPIRSYFLFSFASVIFAFQVFTILTGIVYVFKAFELDQGIIEIASVVSICLVVLSIQIIGIDQWLACSFFKQKHSIALGSVVAIVFGLSFLVWLAQQKEKDAANRIFSVSKYSGAILFFALAICFLQGNWYMRAESEIFDGKGIKPPIAVPIGLYLLVLGFGAWTCRLIWKNAGLSWSAVGDRLGQMFKK